jgi:hypothetical protein
MRQIRAVDPKNPGGSWTASMTPSEFAVQHFDPKRNMVMGIDGKLPDSLNNILLIFETLAAAEEYSANQVLSRPAVGCLVYDHRGRLVKSVINDSAPELRPRAAGIWEIVLGTLFLAGGGLLIYADFRVNLTLIIGVLIGSRLIFAGIVQVTRGISGLAAKAQGRSRIGSLDKAPPDPGTTRVRGIPG